MTDRNSMEIPIVEARTISECQDNNNLSSALINSAVLRCDGHGVTVNMPWRTNFICVDCQTWFLGITCKNTIYFACFFCTVLLLITVLQFCWNSRVVALLRPHSSSEMESHTVTMFISSIVLWKSS